eukprot:Filipodium_phascolosomae@DN7968_c0_g1_i2.p1
MGFSTILLKNPFRLTSLGGVICVIFGSTIVAFNHPETIGEHITDSNWGYFLCICSAITFSLFSVLVKRHLDGDSAGTTLVYGLFGVYSAIVGSMITVICSVGKLIPFQFPNFKVIVTLLCNGLLGTALGGYLFGVSVLYLSPLVSNIGVNTTIPLSVIADGIVLHSHTYSSSFIFGTTLVFLGAATVSWNE